MCRKYDTLHSMPVNQEVYEGADLDHKTRPELIKEVLRLRGEVVRLHKMAYLTIPIPWRRKGRG